MFNDIFMFSAYAVVLFLLIVLVGLYYDKKKSQDLSADEKHTDKTHKVEKTLRSKNTKKEN